MFPNIGTIMFPEMQYGSLIISVITTALMIALCLFPSKRPGIIGYICLTAGFVGIITSALLVTEVSRKELTPYYHLLYGVYNILIYIAVLVLLHLTKRQQKRESKPNKYLQIGNYFIYLGYLWSVVVLAADIAFIILRLKSEEYLNPSTEMEIAESRLKSYQMSQQVARFAYYSIWGFVAINLILTLIFYNTFKDTSKRYALMLFNLLTIVAMISSTAITSSLLKPGTGFDNAKIVGFISIFLLDLPNALAIATWFLVHGGKHDRQQSVLLHSEADIDTTSSNANILPAHNHSI